MPATRMASAPSPVLDFATFNGISPGRPCERKGYPFAA
nr:MAG TPA: hypothetical protein [Caudoviricetes sp.]